MIKAFQVISALASLFSWLLGTVIYAVCSCLSTLDAVHFTVMAVFFMSLVVAIEVIE